MIKMPRELIEQICRQFNTADPTSKITFNDFLALLQKEAFFREALSDAQMYQLSGHRLIYAEEQPLVTAQ